MRGWAIKPDFVARDLLEATDIINERNLARSRRRKRRALTVKALMRNGMLKKKPARPAVKKAVKKPAGRKAAKRK